MTQEVALLSEEAHQQLRKAATVIDKKLMHEKNEVAAQTRLHQAKALEKYILRKSAKWTFRGALPHYREQTTSSCSGISSGILSPILELDGA